MNATAPPSSVGTIQARDLSLYHLLNPEVLSNPYPLLSRLPRLALDTDRLEWGHSLGLRGLKALPVTFEASEPPRNSSFES
jgi:hypothetical protein